MFEVVTTGKNPNYGKRGQRRMLANHFLMVCLKRGWIERDVTYVCDNSVAIKNPAGGCLK